MRTLARRAGRPAGCRSRWSRSASRSGSACGGGAASGYSRGMFDPAIYAARRDAYMQAIGPGAVAVVRSLPERLRNGDAHHVFRQHSDLVYLTGFLEPDTTLVLRPGAPSERVVMFVRPSDAEAEVWDGRRAGVDGVKARY